MLRTRFVAGGGNDGEVFFVDDRAAMGLTLFEMRAIELVELSHAIIARLSN